jgi:uncharacterized protein YjbI with pentapeptide repeats
MTTTTRISRIGLATAIAAFSALLGIQVLSAQSQEPTSRPMDRERFLKGSCDGCDLSGMDFSRLELKSVSAAGANLSETMFYRADLTNANLGGANLTKANLNMANLTNTNLSNANLTGANLGSTTGASLAGAITTETTTCPNGQVGPCR